LLKCGYEIGVDGLDVSDVTEVNDHLIELEEKCDAWLPLLLDVSNLAALRYWALVGEDAFARGAVAALVGVQYDPSPSVWMGDR
jgi:hypothetical protein